MLLGGLLGIPFLPHKRMWKLLVDESKGSFSNRDPGFQRLLEFWFLFVVGGVGGG